jgi:peroxiredoxin
MVLEIITETDDGSPADVEDLNTWADTYGLTMPVLSDPDSALMWQYAANEGGDVGLPFTVVIDRGVVIDSIASGSQSSAAVELL